MPTTTKKDGFFVDIYPDGHAKFHDIAKMGKCYQAYRNMMGCLEKRAVLGAPTTVCTPLLKLWDQCKANEKTAD